MTTHVNPEARPDYHAEVVRALTSIGDPELGEAIQRDRGSKLQHLGIRFPALRKRVKQGFSFYDLPDEDVLEVWDALWRSSPYGDVLFAALEYYAPLVRKHVSPDLWPVIRHWSARVDNWCHSDGLSGLYSRVLEAYPDDVYPQLLDWNSAEGEWLRRISLVSLVHYSGKNAVFLPPGKCCRWSRPASATPGTTCRQPWAGFCASWGRSIRTRSATTSKSTRRR